MLLKRCQDWDKQTRSENRFIEFRDLLLPCFESPYSVIRQLALRLLMCFGEFLNLRKVQSENQASGLKPKEQFHYYVVTFYRIG